MEIPVAADGVLMREAAQVEAPRSTPPRNRHLGPADDAPAGPTGPAKRKVLRLLEAADVQVGGSRPWDVQVHDERTYRRFVLGGRLGIGEAYMDGWWDCPRVDQLVARLFEAPGSRRMGLAVPDVLLAAKSLLVNRQRPSRARHVGKRHYDIGNDLFERMLDRRMVYSCGYWRKAKDLDAAQEAKLDLVCRKLGLEPGMRVLDVGCGWGSFAQFAAERHGVHVTGLTVSGEQASLARQRCEGLDVDVRLQDYRQLPADGAYDRVVSIGMFEHVGRKNYRTFMQVMHGALRAGGLMLLHTIGTDRSAASTDAWTDRYIFPNGMLPSMAQVGAAVDGLFVTEDVHGFGQDYDPTLMAWHRNVEAAWDDLPQYGERFRRMWQYYLLSSAGGFRARRMQLWQFVLARDRGVAGGYASVR